MTLGSTQPLTEMSTRSISWGVKAEEKDKIIVKLAQEDVETSNNLLNNNSTEYEAGLTFTLLSTVLHP